MGTPGDRPPVFQLRVLKPRTKQPQKRRRFQLADPSMREMKLSDLQVIMNREIAARSIEHDGPGDQTNVEEIVHRQLQDVVDELYSHGLLPMACLVSVYQTGPRMWEYDLAWQTRVIGR